MKAMYKSASNFVCRTLDAGASTMESAEKALSDVNKYVEQNSIANHLIIEYNAKDRAAKAHRNVQRKLSEDEEYAESFAAIEALWK